MWVSKVFRAGGQGYPYGNACDMYAKWCHSTNKSELKPAMIVAVAPSKGSSYGHIGINIGGGIIRHNSDHIQDSSLEKWTQMYAPAGAEVRWGWMNGKDLSKR